VGCSEKRESIAAKKAPVQRDLFGKAQAAKTVIPQKSVLSQPPKTMVAPGQGSFAFMPPRTPAPTTHFQGVKKASSRLSAQQRKRLEQFRAQRAKAQESVKQSLRPTTTNKKIVAERTQRRLRESQFRLKERQWAKTRVGTKPKTSKTKQPKPLRVKIHDAYENSITAIRNTWNNFLQKGRDAIAKIKGTFRNMWERVRQMGTNAVSKVRHKMDNSLLGLNRRIRNNPTFQLAQSGQRMSDEKIQAWTQRREERLDDKNQVIKGKNESQEAYQTRRRAEKQSARSQAARESMKFFQPSPLQKKMSGFADKVNAKTQKMLDRRREVIHQKFAAKKTAELAENRKRQAALDMVRARQEQESALKAANDLAKKERKYELIKRAQKKRELQPALERLQKYGIGSAAPIDTRPAITGEPSVLKSHKRAPTLVMSQVDDSRYENMHERAGKTITKSGKGFSSSILSAQERLDQQGRRQGRVFKKRLEQEASAHSAFVSHKQAVEKKTSLLAEQLRQRPNVTTGQLAQEKIEERQLKRSLDQLQRFGIGASVDGSQAQHKSAPMLFGGNFGQNKPPAVPNAIPTGPISGRNKGAYDDYDEGARRGTVRGGKLAMGGLGITAGLMTLGESAEAAGVDRATHAVGLLEIAMQKASAAAVYLKDNLASVSMIGLSVAMMFFEPMVILAGLAKAAVLAAAAFAGWQIGSWLYENVEPVREIAIGVVGSVVEALNSLSAAVSEWWVSFEPTFLQIGGFLGEMWETLNASLQNVGLIQTIQNFGAFVTETLNGLWSGFGDLVMAPVDFVASIVNTVGTLIGELAGAIVTGNWLDVGGAILRAIKGSFLASGNLLLDIGAGVVKAIGQGIRSSINFLVEAVQFISRRMVEMFRDMAGKIVKTLSDGIKSKIAGLKDTLKNAFEQVRSLLPFSDAKEGVFSHLTASGRAIITTMSSSVLKNQGILKKSVDVAFRKTNLGGLMDQKLKKVSLAATLAVTPFLTEPVGADAEMDLPFSLPQIVELYEAQAKSPAKGEANEQSKQPPQVSFGDIVISVNPSGGGGVDLGRADVERLAVLIREQFDVSLNEQLRRSMFDFE